MDGACCCALMMKVLLVMLLGVGPRVAGRRCFWAWGLATSVGGPGEPGLGVLVDSAWCRGSSSPILASAVAGVAQDVVDGGVL